MKGYFGQILRVNLTDRKIVREKVSEETFKKFLGGSGLASKIIFEEVEPNVNPLDPENRLVFAVGPFNGTSIPGSSRWVVAARSPLTYIWGEACGGGYWGPAFKRTGHDGLVFEGRADSPLYLYINNSYVELKDASHLWGKDTYETERAIKKELGSPEIRVACIGPAGERLVRMACIVSDEGQGVAARTGLGAVMGSKNLKAVAVKGTRRIEIHDLDELRELVKILTKKIRSKTEYFRKHGTPGYVVTSNEIGDLPIKYWAQGEWSEGAEKIGTPTYTNTILVGGAPCSPCPIGCHRYVKVEKPEKYATSGMGPEYETLAMLGSLCLVDNLPAIAKANELCNRYGIDTISTGAIIGFLMECYERGWIRKEDTDGMEMTWGDADAMILIVKKISTREGCGNLLAEGIKQTAIKVGRRASLLAVHVKGLDIPAHDPRAFFNLAVNYATGNRGACHNRGHCHYLYSGITLPEVGITSKLGKDRFSQKNMGYVTARYQDHCTLFDSLVQCKFMVFGGLTLTDQVKLLSAVIGWRITKVAFLKIGERIFNLQRVFNNRLGISRKDDSLPLRIFEDTRTGGHAGKIPHLEPMLDEYYMTRGWDSDGKPTKEKLLELGLDEALKPI